MDVWRLSILAIAAAVIVLAIAAMTANAVNSTGPHAAPTAAATAVPWHLKPPTDLAVYGAGDGAVVISWQPPRPAPVGYRIYRAAGRDSPYTIMGTVNAGDMDTFADSSDLAAGVTYAYTVTSYDRQGESAPAGPITVVLVSAPRATPTFAVPTPLPTFAPPGPPTLTVIARASRNSASSAPVAGASPRAGVPLPTTPTPTALAPGPPGSVPSPTVGNR